MVVAWQPPSNNDDDDDELSLSRPVVARPQSKRLPTDVLPRFFFCARQSTRAYLLIDNNFICLCENHKANG